MTSDMLAILVHQPGVGTPTRRGRIKGLRRVTLERVHYYHLTPNRAMQRTVQRRRFACRGPAAAGNR